MCSRLVLRMFKAAIIYCSFGNFYWSWGMDSTSITDTCPAWMECFSSMRTPGWGILCTWMPVPQQCLSICHLEALTATIAVKV